MLSSARATARDRKSRRLLKLRWKNARGGFFLQKKKLLESLIYSAIVKMAVGFYGYLFCVLCVSDLLNVASAVCQYMKQDIAFKVVKSDVVLSGRVNGITDGDSKYFPGIPGAKTIEMSIECIYKGPSMNSAVKIYGVGEFNNILSFKFRLSHLLQCIIFFSNPVYCILFK